MVSHCGLSKICIRWWLCMNRSKVLAGKEESAVAGGVLQIEAVIGCVRVQVVSEVTQR